MKIHSCVKTLLLSIVIIPFFTGCSNEADSIDNPPVDTDYSGKPIMVTVGDVINTGFRSTTRSGHTKEVFIQPLDKNKDTGLELETTIEMVQPVQTRTAIPLANSVFRLVAYKSSTVSPSNYAGQGDFQTDGTGLTTAVAGHELYLPEGVYTFVCYSYGTSNNIPVLDGTATTVPVSNGMDFMTYTKTNVNVEANETGVFTLRDVLFVRHSALVQVEVSAEGYPDDSKINQCVAAMKNMHGPVNWTLGTADDQSLPSSATDAAVNFTWAGLNAAVVTSAQETVLELPSRNISLVFSKLQIGGLTFDNTEVIIPNKQFEPQGNYKIKVEVKRNFIQVGNFKWAKGNIYKEGDNFFIEQTQEGYRPDIPFGSGSLFGWNVLEPTVGVFNDQEYSYATDPCTKILPADTWQTPNRDQVADLLKAGYEWDELKGGAYFGREAEERVFLPATGVRFTYVSTSEYTLNGDLAFYATRIGVTSNQKCNYLQIESFGGLVTDGESKNTGMPIRCVKIK